MREVKYAVPALWAKIDTVENSAGPEANPKPTPMVWSRISTN
jgi:hypothetical protein